MAASLSLLMTVSSACGGGEPSTGLFGQAESLFSRLLPPATEMSLRLSTLEGNSEVHVDFTISTELASQPRVHVISDEDAIADADFIGEENGFDIYQRSATFWSRLEDGPPPLFAGTPSRQGIDEYLEFFKSGKPDLTADRFWNTIAYAREQFGTSGEFAPTALSMGYVSEWMPGVGGVRLEAISSERRLYVGVLFAAADGASGSQDFEDELLSEFEERFVVPAGAEARPENLDWGYANRIWYAETVTDPD